MGGPLGQHVYTITNADRPYRLLIEQMKEGAVTLSNTGLIVYCNEAFASLLGKTGRPDQRDSISSNTFLQTDIRLFDTLLSSANGGHVVLTLVATGDARCPSICRCLHCRAMRADGSFAAL